ncbi:MAG: S41 family peptidase [Planctomycetota bacterium]
MKIACALVAFSLVLGLPGSAQNEKREPSTHTVQDVTLQNHVFTPAEGQALAEALDTLLATLATTYFLEVPEPVTLQVIPGDLPVSTMSVDSKGTLAFRCRDLHLLTPVSKENIFLMRGVFYPIVQYIILQSLSTPLGLPPGFVQGLVIAIADDVIQHEAHRKVLEPGLRITPAGREVLQMMRKAKEQLGLQAVSYALTASLVSRPAGYEFPGELRDAFLSACDEATLETFFPRALARPAAGIRCDETPLEIPGLSPELKVSKIRVLGDIPVLEQLGPPLTPEQRAQLFTTVWRSIASMYPDPQLKGVDWAAVFMEFRSQVSFCRSDLEFYVLLRLLLASLQDANTRFQSPEGVPAFHFPRGIETDLVAGVPVVTRVAPDLQGPAAQVKVGMVVESINGEDVRQRLQDLVEFQRMFEGMPNERTRLLRAANVVLGGCPGTVAHVAFRGPEGESVEVDLPLEPYPRVTKPAIEASFLKDKKGRDTIGYVRIRGFMPEVETDFDSKIAPFIDLPNLIIDLRTTVGGHPSIGAHCIGKLIETPATIGNWRLRDNQETHATPLQVNPRAPVFKGRIVLLVDGYCVGAPELFALALRTLGRAKLVGERTAGSLYSPRPFPRSVGTAQLWMGRFEFVPGATVEPPSTVEGRGIEVDIEVAPTIEDIRAGRDPVLERAVTYLSEES